MTVLTTGVLLRDPNSLNAHVDVVNLDSAKSLTATVEIWDWGIDKSSNKPKAIKVGPSGSVTVGPHTHQSFGGLINESVTQPGLSLVLYEVRVTLSTMQNVVVNAFAIDASGNIFTDNTVLHSDLVQVSL